MSATSDPRLSTPAGLAMDRESSERAVTLALEAAVRAYAEAARAASRAGREPPPALTSQSGVAATEVAIVVDALLRAADLDLFEIQMWRCLGEP